MWTILPKRSKWLLKEGIVSHFISGIKLQLASPQYLEVSIINRKELQHRGKRPQKALLFKD